MVNDEEPEDVFEEVPETTSDEDPEDTTVYDELFKEFLSEDENDR